MRTSAQSEMNHLLPTLTARSVVWLVGTVRCVEAAIMLEQALQLQAGEVACDSDLAIDNFAV